jgi:pyridoxal phosphate phosphatase PHOSPHO2
MATEVGPEETTQTSPPAPSIEKKVLFAFDFDHTLVEGNSDTILMEMVPQLKIRSKVRELRKTLSWIEVMNHAFKVQFDHGCKRDDVLKVLHQIDLIENMRIILDMIKGNASIDKVVISDANTLSIQTILARYNLDDGITIYSNPASFDDTGLLTVSAYHSHECVRCNHNPNMCKGTIIRDILKNNSYSRVLYIGDGSNDYCAAMNLSPYDHVITRDGYGFMRKVKEYGLPPPQLSVIDFQNPSIVGAVTDLMPK